MLNTLAVIPAIGTESDWRKKGTIPIRAKGSPGAFQNKDTLITLAAKKALAVTPYVLVVSDNSAVLREAAKLKLNSLRVKRGKYHTIMSNGDLYMEALDWWAKKQKEILLDILLVVNWETPLVTTKQLAELTKLDEHDASSACIVYKEDGRIWRSQQGYSRHIQDWDWHESLFVDTRAGYSTWVGDYVMMRHFRVPRHYMHVIPKNQGMRVTEPEDMKIVKGILR